MADTATTFPIINGASAVQQQNAMADASGNVSPQSVPRVNGAPVSNSNPLPTSFPTGSSISQAPLLASGVASVSGTITSQSQTVGPFIPAAGRNFNATGYGASMGVNASLGGTIVVERSIDGGTTFLPLTGAGSPVALFTTVFSEQMQESQVGVSYQFLCTGFTGPQAINVRFAQ